MMMDTGDKNSITQVPTNIITGFLGVGKTTVIQKLLSKKPLEERWAVLVNEFGEVGIDSNLFSSAEGQKSGVTISQVPGGCMCCTNGLPMQMALNLLLKESKPHRLLIEPTGLGHPKEVFAILSGEYYREVLNLQATLSLVDARKINDARYTSDETFNQQIEIAEVVIANKADLYHSNEFPLLVDYVDAKFGLDEKQIYQVRHGAVELEWLARAASEKNQNAFRDAAPINNSSALPPTLDTPREGFVSADNAGEGFFSRGWIFNPGWQFDSVKLLSLFQGLDVERLKGVFITSEGFVGFNKVDDVVTQLRFNFMPDSRVEVISRQQEILAGLEKSLLDCRINSRASS